MYPFDDVIMSKHHLVQNVYKYLIESDWNEKVDILTLKVTPRHYCCTKIKCQMHHLSNLRKHIIPLCTIVQKVFFIIYIMAQWRHMVSQSSVNIGSNYVLSPIRGHVINFSRVEIAHHWQMMDRFSVLKPRIAIIHFQSETNWSC